MSIHYEDIPIEGDPKITYNVLPTNEVKMKVTIGEGQPHYSINVFLDRVLKGSSSEVSLGNPDDVRGKRIMIVVVVQDRLDETNWTSFTAKIKQGPHTVDFGPYKKEAAQHMDTVIYTLKIFAQ